MGVNAANDIYDLQVGGSSVAGGRLLAQTITLNQLTVMFSANAGDLVVIKYIDNDTNPGNSSIVGGLSSTGEAAFISILQIK